MRIIGPILLSILFLSACDSGIETIRVERDSSLIFSVEGYDEPWKSDKSTLHKGRPVVHHFTGDSPVSIKFTRHFLIFEGRTPENKPFEMVVTLDLADTDDLRHTYSADYRKDRGGLHQISLIITESTDPFKYVTAELCAVTIEDAYFRIDRYHEEESLIAGSMEAVLCKNDETEQQFFIYDATFRDIQIKAN